MLVSYYQNADQNQDMKIVNRAFENVSQFKYLGTTITNKNLIQSEIKKRLNFGNAYYHSVLSLFSSYLLYRNIKLVYMKPILPVVHYGYET
jgi:hypothetical protein